MIASLIVSGPSHCVKCYAEKESHGRYRIFYCPTEVGLFTITVTWNEEHIDGKYTQQWVVHGGGMSRCPQLQFEQITGIDEEEGNAS